MTHQLSLGGWRLPGVGDRGDRSEIRDVATETIKTYTMDAADMVPDNPGKWLFHCHVSSHLRMGMQAFYTVEP